MAIIASLGQPIVQPEKLAYQPLGASQPSDHKMATRVRNNRASLYGRVRICARFYDQVKYAFSIDLQTTTSYDNYVWDNPKRLWSASHSDTPYDNAKGKWPILLPMPDYATNILQLSSRLYSALIL